MIGKKKETKDRTVVYICSPLRGAYARNIENAKMYSRAAVLKGYLPITPHIYFTQFMDDRVEEERATALELGKQLLMMCDELWIFGDLSEGMIAEIELADLLRIPTKNGFEMVGQDVWTE